MTSHVLNAAEQRLPPCPVCGANRGGPCRTPMWGKTRKPHALRLRVMKEPQRAFVRKVER